MWRDCQILWVIIILIITRVSLGCNAPWPKPTWKLEIDKILFRWVFGRKLPNHEPITSMKWDKTLDETRKKFPLFRVDIWTRRKNPELVKGNKDRGEKSCVALIVLSLIMTITPRLIFTSLSYEAALGVRENVCQDTSFNWAQSASWTMNRAQVAN